MVRNALDIWFLGQGDSRYDLWVCRYRERIMAHISIYRTPEANYVALGGTPEGAERLLDLVPNKAILTCLPELGDLVEERLNFDAKYSNDMMLVSRGEEALRRPDIARRLSREDASEYTTFGTSFGVGSLPIDWIQERLDSDIIFGSFSEGRLASVASLVAWLPQVSVILAVETKPEFRGKGHGAVAVSAALREGLRRSQSCTLAVRSDNEVAIALYRSLGFSKIEGDL
jgi:RimJ/RimL family protein N-acetyltransferase